MVPGNSSTAAEHQKLKRTDKFTKDQPIVASVGTLGPAYWDWLAKPETGHPRFFKSDVLEACSKTPWWIVPVVWLPLFFTCFWYSHSRLSVPISSLIADLLVGIVAWQLLEYTIHRFVFHARCSSYWGITLHFLFHGCHHKYPMDRLRLVFPPVPASALVALVYWVLHALFQKAVALPVFAGMGIGYVLYDCLHYAVHHHGASLKGPLLKDLRHRHMQHHYHDSTHGYGISSVLFDVLFGTAAMCDAA